MGLKNVPHETICTCGSKARPGQRTCKVCHADRMKDYRRRQARDTITGYVDLRHFLDYRDGTAKTLVVSAVPGGKHGQTPVKVTILCKNHKQQ